uniref:Putative secreted protein n=1 Tax=Anopheles darlingi TaxID=43151 RepID=A0A2M4DQL7_ANODA
MKHITVLLFSACVLLLITYTDGLFTGSWEDFYTESSSSEESGKSPNYEVIAKQASYSYMTIAMPKKCPKGSAYSHVLKECKPIVQTFYITVPRI